MTIAGLGNLSGVPLYSLASKGASSAIDTPILSTQTSYNRAYPPDPDIDSATDAAHVSLTPPPNTVESIQMSSTSASVSYLASGTSASSTDQYSAESSSASASYDVSYNTPISTLASLGFIQQGDVLLHTTVTEQEQQSQQSATQSATASQQATAQGTAASGTTQSSTATASTQQTDSEQSSTTFYTQDWMTPNGQSFIFQELVRFNQSADGSQAQADLSNASTPPIDAIGNAVTNAPAAPTPVPTTVNATADTDTDTNNHAAAKSAAEVQLSTLSTQVMNSVMNSWLQLSNTAGSTGGGAQSGASATTSGANASQTSSANSTNQSALLKQANSLLALFESLSNAGQTSGATTAAPVETAS